MLHRIGHAWNTYCGTPQTSPEVKIDWICVSMFPPGPNHPSPLCEKDGHASCRTNTSIASSNTTTERDERAEQELGAPVTD